MKRILVLCNTYFQLITAIRLKQTIKKNDEVYLVLSDHSINAKQIFERLKEKNYFKDVWYFNTEKLVRHRNKCDTLKNIWRGFYGKNLLHINHNLCFDEIIGYNLDIPSHLIYAYFKRKNKNMTCNRFEEGIFSYHTLPDNCRELKIIYRLRTLFKKQNMREETKLFYCFQPSFYKGELEAVRIPTFSKNDTTIKDLLTDIFGIGVQKEGLYKYLYLPCIYDIEGGDAIGELKLAEKIAASVGKDKLLIKVHPRDDKTKYIRAGFHVAESSAAPLEALVINGNYQDMVFLTSLSGSILTITTILEIRPKSYYLYPLCDLARNPMAQHYSKVLEEYLNQDESVLNNITIASTIDCIK